ncbi:MAG: death-on-curing protein [Candidatus Moranbacteria bacterium]|nr:death-on-curing protein [Candidatus Moranbacteria bacterium]
MTHEEEKQNKIVIYQNSSGAIELRGDIKNETIWANLNEIALLFGRDKSVISRHIKDIFKQGELTENATVAKNATVQNEGGRKITRTIEYYNLDVILSVGYRVNSKTATQFRQWATKTLREHITKGFTINRKQIAKNYDSFMKAVPRIEKLLPENSPLDSKSTIELIKIFANAWVSLGAYDRETIKTKSITKRSVKITSNELLLAINEFKKELIRIDNETDLFAKEMQSGSVDGIVGNVI